MQPAEWMGFFFEAMTDPNNSWAGGAEAQPVPERPGWKGYKVERGVFRLTDAYTKFAGTLVLGQTILQKGDVTFLVMNYGGPYPKTAAEAVKKVLRETYSKGIFYFGRGQDGLRTDDGFVYYNHTHTLREKDDYSFIAGQEDVHHQTGGHMGFHEYTCHILGRFHTS